MQPSGARVRASTTVSSGPISTAVRTAARPGRRRLGRRQARQLRRGRRPGLVEGRLQAPGEVSQRGFGFLQRDVAAADQRLGIELPYAAMVFYQLVQQRLGEGRVVLLVVAVAPVTDHVDDDVLVELLAESQAPAGPRGRRPPGRRR